MRINLNIGVPGGEPLNKDKNGSSREHAINHINSLNIDDSTRKELLKQIKSCPSGALLYYIENINNKISNIRGK